MQKKRFEQKELKGIANIISSHSTNLSEGFKKAADKYGRTPMAISSIYYRELRQDNKMFSLNSEKTGKKTVNVKNKPMVSKKSNIDAKMETILNKLSKPALIDIILER